MAAEDVRGGFPVGLESLEASELEVSGEGWLGLSRGVPSALWSFRGRYGSRTVKHYGPSSPPGPFCLPSAQGSIQGPGETTLPLKQSFAALLCRSPSCSRDGETEARGDELRVGHGTAESWGGALA